MKSLSGSAKRVVLGLALCTVVSGAGIAGQFSKILSGMLGQK